MILTINNISKSYGRIQALQGVSFSVPEGSIFGVLGPNGSGKTTLLGILLNVLQPDSGSYAWLEGNDNDAARRQIGALLETPNFYHYMSAMDNLQINAAIKQLQTDDRLAVLEQVGLLARKDSKFSTYSLGMKQRLAIGAALLGKPRVLVFDEPTNGLDPAGIAEIRELILQLHAQGHTILMASHLLDEVEKVCTHVAILKHGQLLLHGAVDEVLVSQDQIEVRAADMQALQAAVQGMAGVLRADAQNGGLRLQCEASVLPQHINEYCMGKGIVLSHLAVKKKSLEAKFMELTN